MSEAATTKLNSDLVETFGSMRLKLLDTSKRNPLTSVKLQAARAKQINVVDELSEQIFQMLYRDARTFSFLPRESSDAELELGSEQEGEEDSTLYVPEEQIAEVKASHTDTKLQTNLGPTDLHKRLLSLFRESRSVEEDLGVNVLYLALGFLHYYEAESSSLVRTAPLILLPVELKRDSSKAMFKLVARDDELVTNQSLSQMMQTEFQLPFPVLPEGDDWRPQEYFEIIEGVVSSKARWQVDRNEMLLRFFSFEKYMMSRELEKEALESFAGSEGKSIKIVSSLFGTSEKDGGGKSGGSPSLKAEDRNLDKQFEDPRDLGHILDADTSQTHVITAAMKGDNLVVQGPPGTGKSQTITNMIGTAVASGKKVLFVAEKKAALDVVYRRLKMCGLGHMCLELHSHKANRKHFYQDLKETLGEVELPTIDETQYTEIKGVRDRLNRLSELVHTVDETGNTPYLLMGRISNLTGKGIKPGNFVVDGIDSWTKDEFETRLNVVSSLAQLVQELGTEQNHPWYGISKRLTPLDQTRLKDLLSQQIALEGFDQAEMTQFAESISATYTESILARETTLQTLRTLPENVAVFVEFLQTDMAKQHLSDLCNLISQISTYQALANELNSQVIDAALETNWEMDANAIRQSGKSFFRFLNGGYRAAIGRLKANLKNVIPKDLDSRLKLLEQLVEANQLQRQIKGQSGIGTEYFGVSWSEHLTNIHAKKPVVEWLNEYQSQYASVGEILELVSAVQQIESSDQIQHSLEEANNKWQDNWTQINDLLGLDVHKAFGSETIDEVHISAILERVRSWQQNLDKTGEYHQLATTCNEVAELGMPDVVAAINDERLQPKVAVDTVMLLRCEKVLNNMMEKQEELKSVSGRERSELVEQFKKQDKQLQKLAAHEIVAQHDEQLPRGFSGQIGLLRGEANKKSRHIPIRQALDNAWEALLLIKPIFLMSPMSISRFLTPGKISFDLLLIDEASQVKPEEALGAMLRASQVVVVGDQKQMPPTSFFDKQVTAEALDEDEEEASLESLTRSQLSDMESVLSLCEARGFPSAMLSWHYRSEHPSLIEVSNHEFYDNKLVYPPSAHFGGGDIGLQLVKTNGVYSRAKGRNNRIEAEKVCEGILEHVTNYPAQTLGVVALSTAQRDAIQNTLDELCRDHPDLDRYCHEEHDEKFFIKNLENVQGDERDVIFVSIGYGPDENGKLFQSFGPVSGDGGERRLNVLFTRSRKKCVIFSSMTHDQIRDDAARFAGPKALKQFLKYAETGEMDIPLVTGEDMDSPFEEAVAKVLTDHGYKWETQVGASGFKIDLAVYNPDREGHFLIAIECDGARYHSSSWARERDRLRQEVLETKGWIFHRIWSTDWFYSQETEVEKLLTAIERARAHQGNFRAEESDDRESVQEFRKEVDTSDDEEEQDYGIDIETSPYTESQFDIFQKEMEIHEVGVYTLRGYVKDIVATEGPIHTELISTRLARLWEKKRTGRRIVEAVDEAINDLLVDSVINRVPGDMQFVEMTGEAQSPTIRNRGYVDLTQVRDPDYIPLSEIGPVIEAVVKSSVSIENNECAKMVAATLGTNIKRQQLEERVMKSAMHLHEQGLIEIQGTTFKRK